MQAEKKRGFFSSSTHTHPAAVLMCFSYQISEGGGWGRKRTRGGGGGGGGEEAAASCLPPPPKKKILDVSLNSPQMRERFGSKIVENGEFSSFSSEVLEARLTLVHC